MVMESTTPPSTTEPASPPGPQLAVRSVRDLYYVLFRHARASALVFFALLLPLCAYVVLSPSVYQADAKLLVRLGRQSVSLDPTATTGKTVGINQSRLSEINSEIEIIGSSDLLTEVVASVFGAHGPQAAALAEDLSKRLSVKALEESNIIRLSYTDESGEQASLVLRELIDRYLAKHIDVHRTEGSYAFFLDQAEQLAETIKTREARIRDLKNEGGIASIEDQRRTLLERASRQEGLLEDLEAELAGAAGAKSDPATARLSERLNELRLQEMDLRARYLPDSPLVQAARAQIVEAEGLLADLESADRTAIEARMEVIRGQVANIRTRLIELNDKEVLIERLQRELDLDNLNYSRYSESLEQARIDQALDRERISNIRVVQPATLPASPSGAPKPILLALALILATTCALGTAFALEFLDDSIPTPEAAERKLGLPVLAALPKTKPALVGSAPAALPGDRRPLHGELATLRDQLRTWRNDRRRVFGESSGSKGGEHLPAGFLRLSPGSSSNGATFLALTSSEKESGVSTVAANLAMLLAKDKDDKVLLVDVYTSESELVTVGSNAPRRRTGPEHSGQGAGERKQRRTASSSCPSRACTRRD